MYPGTYATSASDRAAIIMGSTGEVVTYRQLHERSNQFSHYLRSIGLAADDVVAILMTNNPRYHEVAWGTRQIGRYFTPVNTHLTPDEVVHIINDSGATVVVAVAWGDAAAPEVGGSWLSVSGAGGSATEVAVSCVAATEWWSGL